MIDFSLISPLWDLAIGNDNPKTALEDLGFSVGLRACTKPWAIPRRCPQGSHEGAPLALG